jgi:type IV pilus assembly protein PilY1
VDATTGLFKDSSQEIWSAVVDGRDVNLGGAAAMLPAPGQRHLYTYLDSNRKPSSPVDLTGNAYAISAANGAVSDAVLGTGVANMPTRTQLLDWLQGYDVQDENGNGNVAEARKKTMGDPLHAQPAVVVYGGSAATPNINDAVLFVATNDGFLHAVDVTDGHELWAYVPAEKIGDQAELYNDDPIQNRHYGLDGDVKVEKFDVNGNGIVDGNDRVLLYFGMGRGGNNLYALDVTDKTHPKFVWSLGSTDLPGVGQTWSSPVLANVNIGSPPSTQNSQRLVLIFGGGYDPTEDGSDITGPYQNTDTVGNHIFMVDAITGALLWSAGPTTGSDTLKLTRMDHSIPSGVTVVDLNGDGYADRMYVGDMAGQLWRFDIYNGLSPSNLVTGGVMASLGAHDDSPKLIANARRFYAQPDISLVATRGVSPYLNIAIGSGYRGHPLNTGIQDRFYGLRDFNVSTKLTQAQYNALSVVHDTDMTDITDSNTPTIAATAPGWKLRMDQHGGWVGEKILGASTTLGGRVLFTTYSPSATTTGTNCLPNTGTNRAYAISVIDGSSTVDVNADGTQTTADRSMVVATGSIVGEVTVLFMGDGRIPVIAPPNSCTAGSANCSCDVNGVCTTNPPPACQAGDPNCTCAADGTQCHLINPDTVCTAGVASIPVCTQTNRLRKTFWMENAAN